MDYIFERGNFTESELEVAIIELFKNEEYTPRQYQFSKKDEEIEIFIKDVMEMILEKSDFALVDRVHEDLSWQKAYKNPDSKIINIKDIDSEYSQINID